MGIIVTILMYLGIVIGAIIGAYIIFMLIMALGPRKPVSDQHLEKTKKPFQKEDIIRTGSKKDVRFNVKGTPVNAWLFLPEDLSIPVPCVIMAHGLGCTKAVGLEAYAIRYQEAGCHQNHKCEIRSKMIL
jgi:hypothetical protein